MQGIYRKIIYDWIDAMKPDGFVDTAPFVGIEYCGLSWESAFLFLQEALWIHYGDTELVKDLYETDQAWMEKVARLHPNLIVDNGLSDHESLEKVPVELTGTCHYYQIARIMARFAAVNGDPDGVASYSALAERIRLKIIDLFWDQPAITVPNQQTLLATLLACGVLDEPDRRLAMGRLLDVLQQADYHVTTGIFGTRFLLEALSSNGRTDIAFRLVNQPGFPGWKYMIDNGATTIWETWKESDNTFSQNHPMFGSVSGWYLKWLGGIQPDSDNPAPDAVILKPRPVRELNSVTVEKYFPAGTVRSGWRWEQGTLLLEFDIPPGLTTTWIPEETSRSVVVRQSPDGWNISQSSDKLRINLSKPGRYAFAIQRSE
jgi:alpha-L-rhamnosidase